MNRVTIALTAAGFITTAIVSASLGAIATIRYVGTPLVERNLWFEREMLQTQVDAVRDLEAGATQQALDVLRARSFYAVAMLTSDAEQLRRTKSTPQLLQAAQRVYANLAALETDPIASGNQKELAREACAALR